RKEDHVANTDVAQNLRSNAVLAKLGAWSGMRAAIENALRERRGPPVIDHHDRTTPPLEDAMHCTAHAFAVAGQDDVADLIEPVQADERRPGLLQVALDQQNMLPVLHRVPIDMKPPF